MPQENVNNPLREITRRMTYHGRLGNRLGVAQCMTDYRAHIHKSLVENSSADVVNEHASVLCERIRDIELSLAEGGIRCPEAVVIFQAHVDTFISEFLEPWIRDNYGDDCIAPFAKTFMGKA